jgi:hypothetical protein
MGAAAGAAVVAVEASCANSDAAHIAPIMNVAILFICVSFFIFFYRITSYFFCKDSSFIIRWYSNGLFFSKITKKNEKKVEKRKYSFNFARDKNTPLDK